MTRIQITLLILVLASLFIIGYLAIQLPSKLNQPNSTAIDTQVAESDDLAAESISELDTDDEDFITISADDLVAGDYEYSWSFTEEDEGDDSSLQTIVYTLTIHDDRQFILMDNSQTLSTGITGRYVPTESGYAFIVGEDNLMTQNTLVPGSTLLTLAPGTTGLQVITTDLPFANVPSATFILQ